MMRRRLVGIAVALLAAGTTAQAQPGPLAQPLEITLEANRGAGFLLDAEPGLLLATAAHVLLTSERRPRAEKATLRARAEDGEGIELELSLSALWVTGELVSHAEHDLAVARLGRYQPIDGAGDGAPRRRLALADGVRLARGSAAALRGVEPGAMLAIAEIAPAAEVLIYGFPRAIGLQRMTQLDPGLPLLRRGIVAGVDPARQALVLDCATYPGHGGSPVIDAERRVIGVVSQYVPMPETWLNLNHGFQNATLTNSGFAVAASTDALLELLGKLPGEREDARRD